MERVLDTLQRDVGRCFTISDVNHDGNDKALMQFRKTGHYNFIPGLKRDHFESLTDFNEAMQRTHKIHQTNYVVPPRKILYSLHRKTFF